MVPSSVDAVLTMIWHVGGQSGQFATPLLWLRRNTQSQSKYTDMVDMETLSFLASKRWAKVFTAFLGAF